MSDFPVIYNEETRLSAVENCGHFDTTDEPRFDRLSRLAAFVTETPMALISFIGARRQWFKSRHGVTVREAPREFAFCNYTIVESEMFVVEDALSDSRFRNSPIVTGAPYVRFYAGVPFSDKQGNRLGSLCVLDVVPRHLTVAQIRSLRDLGALTSSLFQADK